MKTFSLFFFAFLLSGITVHAQVDTISNAYMDQRYRPGGYFHIGGFLSPDLSYSTIPRNNDGLPAIKNFQSDYDIPKFSITVGFEGIYQINQNLSLSLGLQYSGKGGKTRDIEYEPSAAGTDPVSMYYVYDYRYIDVPLRLDVYLSKKKVAPFITAGASANVLIGQHTNVFGIDKNDEPMEYTNTSTSGFSAFTPQLQAGAGIDIALKYSRIRIFPVYRLAFTDTKLSGTYAYSTGTVNGKLYSVGLGINCIFRL